MEKLPINERPREKAFLYGIETLTNADLIAILICTTWWILSQGMFNLYII